MVPVFRVVPQQVQGTPVVGYDDVHVAVVVQVSEGGTAAQVPDLRPGTGLAGALPETPLPILVQQVLLAKEDVIAKLVDGGIDVAVGDERIQVSVVVVVEESGRRNPP